MLPDSICSLCDKEGIFTCDYYKSEDLQKKNALPSAEGALMLAMEHTDITVKDMRALVCGYGRIGSLLASMLSSLGADVTVAARRDETLCEISMDGYRAIRIDGNAKELGIAVDGCDVVFNTVPSVILTSAVLEEVKRKPVYIEIASLPGGIDLSAARDVGIRTVFAPSLPGKYSPRSAGKYIFETVSDILSQRSINV
jgi:dipicolinate synthase subunit A